MPVSEEGIPHMVFARSATSSLSYVLLSVKIDRTRSTVRYDQISESDMKESEHDWKKLSSQPCRGVNQFRTSDNSKHLSELGVQGLDPPTVPLVIEGVDSDC